jgi:Right handed beta helix region
MRNKVLFVFAILCCLFIATSLSAQATRTWVSGVGDDANPCSRTAPCKTFAGAISKTATCGEIDVLDPGGFGAVTITKSITIDGYGSIASVANPGFNGIIVNLTVSDACNTVILRWLGINGFSTLGTTGVKDLSPTAHSLHLEHMEIEHQVRGVEITTNNNQARLFMKDVDIRHTSAHNIDIHPAGGQTVTIDLHDVRSRQSNGDGLRLQNNVTGTVTNSQFQGNTSTGVNIFGSSVKMAFVDTDISNNTSTGLVNSSGATTFIDGCSFFGNGNGGINNVGSTMNGFGNNAFGNNTGGDVIGNAVVTLAHP